MYGLDCAGGALSAIACLPHCGAIVEPSQVERGIRVLHRLHEEVTRRQYELARAGLATAEELRAAARDASRPPWLVLFLDGWDGFVHAYQDVEHGRAIELLYRLLADGPAVGLTVAITGDRNALTGRLSSVIANKLVLRLSDAGDYALAGVPAPDDPAGWPPGRGVLVAGAVETQIAVPTTDVSATGQRHALQRIAGAAHTAEAATSDARPVPFTVAELPGQVTLADLHSRPDETDIAGRGPFWLPVGLGGDDLTVVGLQLGPGSSALVAGPPGSGRTSLLAMAACWYLSRGIDVALAGARPDSLPIAEELQADRKASVLGRFGPDDGAALRVAVTDANPGPTAILVDDVEDLVDTSLEAAVLALPATNAVRIVAGATDSMASMYRGLVPLARRRRCGVLLGGYRAIDGELLGVRTSANIDPRPGRALLVERGTLTRVQVALP